MGLILFTLLSLVSSASTPEEYPSGFRPLTCASVLASVPEVRRVLAAEVTDLKGRTSAVHTFAHALDHLVQHAMEDDDFAKFELLLTEPNVTALFGHLRALIAAEPNEATPYSAELLEISNKLAALAVVPDLVPESDYPTVRHFAEKVMSLPFVEDPLTRRARALVSLDLAIMHATSLDDATSGLPIFQRIVHYLNLALSEDLLGTRETIHLKALSGIMGHVLQRSFRWSAAEREFIEMGFGGLIASALDPQLKNEPDRDELRELVRIQVEGVSLVPQLSNFPRLGAVIETYLEVDHAGAEAPTRH